jgi:hypothetical protein
MDKHDVRCPYCGSNAFRMLKRPQIVECLTCGRCYSLDVASQLARASTELSKQAE